MFMQWSIPGFCLAILGDNTGATPHPLVLDNTGGPLTLQGSVLSEKDVDAVAHVETKTTSSAKSM